MIDAAGGRCQICGGDENLQVDHRVPYEVAGEPDGNDAAIFMVLCGACNRKKSWSCEHCPNWNGGCRVAVCETCYWAGSADYLHVAMEQQRRADVVWRENEIADYERLRENAQRAAEAVPECIKRVLRNG
ncbi:MAG: HNH endonuclease [Terracidiphilus sp.]